MALCHDIGYTEMRLPNLLDHDTVAEALQQVIYSCRSLCEAVQASCAPIMACYGYPWPAILHCGRFPAGHGLCVEALSNGSRLGRPHCHLDSRLEVLKAGPLPAVELAPTLRCWLQLDATCVHNLLRGRHAGTYVLSGEVQGPRLLAWDDSLANAHKP
ncbi:secreted frizzled-related protein 1-like [Callorhinus ursinus]|uniref:secreted frizzled-related protein 1-like n=1 Tax=Callorhinus ursinus TaxID=34884 RepID=UPI003CD03745